LRREIGILQCQGSEGGKPLGPRRTKLRQFLVLNFDDLSRGVAILAVPERIDRQHLHIDCHRIHFLQALFDGDEMLRHALDWRQNLVGPVPHQVNGFTEIAMCVDIHREDALAIDFDRQARGLRLGVGRTEHAATAKGYSARGRASQEITSGGHWSPPSIVRIRFLRPVD
jgi:hypothetical protein